jgi:hypothetical protein
MRRVDWIPHVVGASLVLVTRNFVPTPGPLWATEMVSLVMIRAFGLILLMFGWPMF